MCRSRRSWLARSYRLIPVLLPLAIACDPFAPAAPVDGGPGPADAAVADAISDAAVTDADAEAACASTEVIVGTAGTDGKSGDSVPNPAADAYGYVTTTAAPRVATCIWIYLPAFKPTTTDVALGVYADGNGAPSSLLASTKLTLPLRVGWNAARLGSALAIQPNTTYWLTVAVGSGEVSVLTSTCIDSPLRRHSQPVTAGQLPQTFAYATLGEQCAAAFYLAP